MLFNLSVPRPYVREQIQDYSSSKVSASPLSGFHVVGGGHFYKLKSNRWRYTSSTD